MKKFGLLCLALVLALGALGVGYASWTDTIFVEGTVCTGDVCLSFQPNSWGEAVCTTPGYDPYPDKNWCGWIASASPLFRSCPPGYVFESTFCVDKDVAWVTFIALDADGVEISQPVPPNAIVKTLEVTIHNAYPHFAADISFWICNCGTIPVIVQEPVITQSNFLLIQYGDNIGTQLHPDDCVEISFVVGVVQHEGYYGYGGNWIVDDPLQPLTPQNNCGDITFTIDISAVQWAECNDA